MKYKRGDQLIHRDTVVEIVDRDPHFHNYLIISLENKGKVGGIQELITPEHAEKIEIRSNNPFAKKRQASETPSLATDFTQYQEMMDLSIWVNEKDLRKINFEPNWFQRIIIRLFL